MMTKNKIISITPFVCVIAFVLTYYFTKSSYSWLIFLLIPFIPYILGKKRIKEISFTVLVAVAYVVLGLTIEGFWHPGWVIFLLIPIYNILVSPKQRFWNRDWE